MFAALALSTILTISSPEETDCLFVLTHAGETLELLPVIEEMEKQSKDYRVIALNVAKDLVKGRVPSDKLIEKPPKAKKVITGVHSDLHQQYLDLYRESAETYAYWDNPEPRGAAPYYALALKVQASAKKVLFPSAYVASSPEFQNRPTAEKIVVGKPTLLKFKEELALSAKDESDTILFVGTYGEGYEKALTLFVRSLQNLRELKSKVVFQKHPMSKDHLEEQYAKAIGGAVSQVPLLEAMGKASLVVTYNSSAGFQALVGGKSVLFVVPEGDAYTNSLIDQKLVFKAANQAEIRNVLRAGKKNEANFDLFSAMGIPIDPINRFIVEFYSDN